MKLALISTTNPTLSAGAFTTVFGDYEKVMYAHVMFDNPEVNDYIYAATVSISEVTVTVTLKRTQVSSVTPTWANATTTNITFVVLAEVV